MDTLHATLVLFVCAQAVVVNLPRFLTLVAHTDVLACRLPAATNPRPTWHSTHGVLYTVLHTFTQQPYSTSVQLIHTALPWLTGWLTLFTALHTLCCCLFKDTHTHTHTHTHTQSTDTYPASTAHLHAPIPHTPPTPHSYKLAAAIPPLWLLGGRLLMTRRCVTPDPSATLSRLLMTRPVLPGLLWLPLLTVCRPAL
jgi:hypothetical protein